MKIQRFEEYNDELLTEGWLGDKLNEMVETELSDTGRIKEDLMALQLQFELDEISEQEYNEKEKGLLDRLDTISNME